MMVVGMTTTTIMIMTTTMMMTSTMTMETTLRMLMLKTIIIMTVIRIDKTAILIIWIKRIAKYDANEDT